MRGFSLALMSLSLAAGCSAPTAYMPVSRTLLAPLPEPPAAALASNHSLAVFGAIAGLPAGARGATQDTGVQLPMVQLDLGALYHFHSGVLLAVEVHGTAASFAVKTNRDQLNLNGAPLFGSRVRAGYALLPSSGPGLVAEVALGLELLPFNDNLSGPQPVPMYAAAASLTPTWQWGRSRVFAGPVAQLVPSLTRIFDQRCDFFHCEPSIPTLFQLEIAWGATAGVRLSFDHRAVALHATVTHASYGWAPTLSLTVSTDALEMEQAPRR